MLAVERVVRGGEKPSVVRDFLGLCRSSIYTWLRAHAKDGWYRLVESIAQEPEPKRAEK